MRALVIFLHTSQNTYLNFKYFSNISLRECNIWTLKIGSGVILFSTTGAPMAFRTWWGQAYIMGVISPHPPIGIGLKVLPFESRCCLWSQRRYVEQMKLPNTEESKIEVKASQKQIEFTFTAGINIWVDPCFRSEMVSTTKVKLCFCPFRVLINMT